MKIVLQVLDVHEFKKGYIINFIILGQQERNICNTFINHLFYLFILLTKMVKKSKEVWPLIFDPEGSPKYALGLVKQKLH